ncbi:MAG: sigma-70 family RNA polymerase sigma factor [Anaerolineales bacterium]
MTAQRVKPTHARETSSGSEAWFERVFQEHYTRIHALCTRMLGDPDEAEDLALEAFVRLHRRPPPDRDAGKLGGWLYRVATNLGLNALRARRRRKRYEDEAGMMSIESDTYGDPAAELERALERARVQRTLASMKPRSAQILLLRHSGLSYAEIGAALELSTGSIGTLLSRAEREFERIYKKQV